MAAFKQPCLKTGAKRRRRKAKHRELQGVTERHDYASLPDSSPLAGFGTAALTFHLKERTYGKSYHAGRYRPAF